MIKSNDYMMLEKYLMGQLVKTFPSKKEAQQYATSIGWQQFNVVKVARRFESVWIVGANHIQPDKIAGMEFDTYRLPTGNYEIKNGSNQMIVLEVKKYLEKSA